VSTKIEGVLQSNIDESLTVYLRGKGKASDLYLCPKAPRKLPVLLADSAIDNLRVRVVSWNILHYVRSKMAG
jgi:hypothetical protein